MGPATAGISLSGSEIPEELLCMLSVEDLALNMRAGMSLTQPCILNIVCKDGPSSNVRTCSPDFKEL